ncbi:hypothetical protein [Cyclobacterium jeungdonense]|uniref:Glycosyl-4,4'-diaponeurosporenoate acyltransferase n=1 Tax=Cyclobacterium jeungdonense TaxID=708087 RepID=A0ABT8CC15_9BACT|nr:hypothetical protein [Cyclobacterium jeungdonense]MDN3690355.1 hypothetical protein [Cyclobacterium jeungdonense]
MLRKIGFLLLSLFLAFRSYEMVNGLSRGTIPDLSLFESVFISFLLALFLTGVFAFPGFAFATSTLLPDTYYQIRQPERLKAAYVGLGGEYFKRLLLVAFWGKEKQRKKYFDGTKTGIANLSFQTRQSEFGHLGAFVLLGVASVMLLFRGYTIIFFLTTLLNIIGNGYPILLQRVHRIRIQKIIGR